MGVYIYIFVLFTCQASFASAFSPTAKFNVMSPASASGSKLHSNFRAAPLRNVAKSNPRTTILLPAAAFDEGDSSNSSKNEKQTPQTGSDLTIRNTALSLRRTSWLSWWIQVILTTVSGITLVFTRGINNANTGYRAIPSGGLVLAGSGKFRTMPVHIFFKPVNHMYARIYSHMLTKYPLYVTKNILNHILGL